MSENSQGPRANSKTDRMACVAAKCVPINLSHPTHYIKSACQHLMRKQMWLRPWRSSQQTWWKTYHRSETFIGLLSWLIFLRRFRICVWALNLNGNICEITHDDVSQHQQPLFKNFARLTTTKKQHQGAESVLFYEGIVIGLLCYQNNTGRCRHASHYSFCVIITHFSPRNLHFCII